MTMLLKISNEDAARTATVIDEEFAVGNPHPQRTTKHEIPPGRTLEVWIHASKRITIEERP